MILAQQYQDGLFREQAQNSFMSFVKAMWPGFIAGRHHAVMAKKFEEIAAGKLKRLIICMPPRHTKSEFASYLLPAWFLGKFPQKKIIQCSNTAELAVGFGRKVRNLVDGETYAKVYPNVALKLLEGGVLMLMVSILLLVWAVPSLVKELTSWLLTILTQNKKQL